MELRKIRIDNTTDVAEFIKAASFVSSHISDIRSDSADEISFEFDNTITEKEIDGVIKDLENLSQKMRLSSGQDETFCKNSIFNPQYHDPFLNTRNIFYFGNSQIGLTGKGLFLLNYFDSTFEKMAMKLGAVKKAYPALLPVQEYLKTGYIKKSPQFAIFCSPVKDSMNDVENLNSAISENNGKEKLKEPEFALSPSACFHTYIEYQNQILKEEKIITFKQNVFRNEGRLNYKELGRLMDYHVREIVFIGSHDFVERNRIKIMNDAAKFLKNLNLNGDITLASDSFVLPKMQMYKTIQKIDRTKYEMHLNTDKTKTISVASFNLHGKAFTDPFNISVENIDTETGCVGFGLQRWVIAFVSQYGWDEKNWPKSIRTAYEKQED